MNQQQKDQHNKTKKKLKIIGISLICFGGVMTAIGLISFFSAFNGAGFPSHFWCAFVGLPCIGIGVGVTSTGYKQEIARYMKNESVPVVNEASEELSPTVRNVTAAIQDGLRGSDSIVCACGAKNGKDSKFCSECGRSLLCVCAHCGATVEADDKFCSHCGNSLR